MGFFAAVIQRRCMLLFGAIGTPFINRGQGLQVGQTLPSTKPAQAFHKPTAAGTAAPGAATGTKPNFMVIAARKDSSARWKDIGLNTRSQPS